MDPERLALLTAVLLYVSAFGTIGLTALAARAAELKDAPPRHRP